MTIHRRCALSMLLLCATPLSAADFCVTSATQLQAALTTAASNGQHDHIRLAVGSYEAPVAAGFTYNAAVPNGDQASDLTISGGWTAFFDNPCGNQFDSTTAFQTTIDGDDRHRALRIRPGGAGNVTIRLLSFIGGDPSTGATNGGGLEIERSGNAGEVRIERSAFLANSGSTGSALHVLGGNVIRVVNNLFAANHASSQYALSLLQHDGTGIYAINNTVVSNTVANAGLDWSTTGGLYVYANGSSRAFVANNILWDNHNHDLRLDGDGTMTLRNNTIEQRTGATAGSELSNVAIEPVFDGGFFDFTLAEGSPLIDAGVDPPTIVPIPTPFHLKWGLPATDLKGAPRIQGGTVDMGAYEAVATGLFANGFE